jgi:CheY-like chemotaxis protein
VNETLGIEAAAELRHELRTPVNHILGYAEMLREDATDESSDATLIDGAIAIAREVLGSINVALPPSGIATYADLTGLLSALRDPQSRLLVITAQLSRGDRAPEFLTDIERIAQAARRLTAVPTPTVRTARHNVARGAVPTPTPGSISPVVGPKGRILIVDDLEENRLVLARRLGKEGYEVDSVASGEEAVRRVAEGGLDLVLLDVLMPGMDGFEVLARLKGDAATRNVPIIMISALDDLSSVVRCIEHGAEDYLAKPFDQVLLRARIGASLEKKRWHDREADYLRQVTRVIEAAGAVEHGTYEAGSLGGITSRNDELGRLARVFDTMAAGVRARETRLQDQLAELRADVSKATTEYEATRPITADTDADGVSPGQLLAGRYVIMNVVGRGGMGVVYRAHDRELNEDVAVKTIRRELLAGDEVVADRLKTEIRLARRISHRNVVRTHDLGDSDGTLFVTMEYVRGITVRELLATRGKLGVASTLALARQFAEALAVAHAAGVIHRDIKPENALIDADGVLKVMDFGIARLAEASTTRTSSGMVVGTPAYMAPEQLLGEEVDPRADLYSLGVVMYECLTGKAPFTAPNPMALIGKVLMTQAEPPDAENADVPPALSALVMRLLAKAPAERPAHAGILLEQLAELG